MGSTLRRTRVVQTRREVERMLADRAPRPDAKSAMRRLPSARPSQDRSETTACSHPTRPAGAQSLALTMSGGGPALCQPSVSHPVSSSLETPCKPAPSVAPNERTERRGEATPLGGQRYKVQFTADQQLHDQIRQAQDLLRHQVPDGDLATVLGKAMTLLVKQLKKQRFGHTDRPRRSNTGGSTRSKSTASAEAKEKSQARSAPPRKPKRASASKPRADAAPEPGTSRHIPAEVRRKVVERDGGHGPHRPLLAMRRSCGRRCLQRTGRRDRTHS